MPLLSHQITILPEKRWVFGTKTQEWYLVDDTDRDFEHGITREEMDTLGPDLAKIKYLQQECFRG